MHKNIGGSAVFKVRLLAFIHVLTFSSVLLADQITLKNGDRLTGTIVKSDDKTLVNQN